VRIGEIGAGQSIRLGDGEAVFFQDDIAHAEAVAGRRAANRNNDVARTVALLERHAGAVFQNVGDGGERRVAKDRRVYAGEGLACGSR